MKAVHEDILIVDDKPANLRLLRTVLGERGYKVRSAVDGGMALKAVEAKSPDLILLDIDMPYLSGFEVCSQLKAEDATREIPVIFLSAAIAASEKVRAFEVGGADYVTKPFQVEEVLARVQHHLALTRMQQELRQLNETLEQKVQERTQAIHDKNARLRESEEKFRNIVEASPMGIFLYDLEADGRLVFTGSNPAADTILGVDCTQFLGQTIEEAFPPLAETEVPDRYRLAAAEGIPWQTEEINYAHGGIAGAYQAYAFQTEPGKMSVMFLDVTERKQAQQALQAYTERLKILQEIDRAILAAHSPETIAEISLQHIGRLIPCQRASVAVWEEATRSFEIIATHSIDGSGLSIGTRFSWQEVEEELGFERLLQGSVHTFGDLELHPHKGELVQAFLARGIRSGVSVPLIMEDATIGALSFTFDQPDAFTEEHIEVAGQVAGSLAMAIQHARLFEQINQANTRLQSLSRQLVEAQEKERRQLARELHDQIGQMLTATKISLQEVKRHTDDAVLRRTLDEHIAIVSQTLDQVRSLSLDLRPSLLDDLGLVPALQWLVERQAERAGFAAEVVVKALSERLPPTLEVTCFRVVQEALTNIMRHAAAQQVRVEVHRTDGEVALMIEDNGGGFDVEAALARASAGTSLGLLGMEERVHLVGGRFRIDSQVGEGTAIQAHFPIPV